MAQTAKKSTEVGRKPPQEAEMNKCKRSKSLTPAILALTALDQAIKIQIARRCPGASLTLLSRRLRFQPVINRHLSWAGHFIPLLRRQRLAAGLNGAALVLLSAGWLRQRSRGPVGPLGRAAASLLLSGGLCSLLDKTLWGGSLDYLQVPGKCTFDLKDLYLAAGLACLAPSCLAPESGERASDL